MMKCLKGRLILISLILLLSSGCSSNEEKTKLLSAENAYKLYDVENMITYTVDEEGALYTTGLTMNNNDGLIQDLGENKPITYLHKYDLNGKQVFSHQFDASILSIDAMAVNGNEVYFTTTGYNGIEAYYVLYSYNIETDKLEQLYVMDYFESVKRLIYLDDRVYILGYKPYSAVDSSKQSENAYQSKGEKIVYYSLSDKKAYDIGINIPISMALNEDNTLMINAYLDNEGYCMLKYDPQKDSVKVAANFNSDKFEYFAISDRGKKIIYAYNENPRGLVISDISSIDEEAELYADAMAFEVYYMKGQVYCITNSRKIVRFALNTIGKDNKIIRYISAGYQADEPFGCGYSMKRTELEDDKFALKVLAQDQDYDLCLMNSSSYTSFNIRKNGVFYPLNEVEGINEYLDSCFPYVKEAATNENGDIWMLPIGVDIPGLLVNEEYLAKKPIGLKNNITYEEFYQILDGMNKDLYEKTSCNSYVIYQNFFAQYFNNRFDLNNEQFRSKLRLFQKYDSYLPSLQAMDWNEDFLYDYCAQSSYYNTVFNMLKDTEVLSVYSMPKQNPTDKNIGTCTFLAVNANSDNRKAALAYLADLISYIMKQEKAPFYFKQPVPERDTLQGSLYELYKNGEITFYIDRDIYEDGFFDVVENGANIEDYISETERKLRTYFNE